MGRHHLYRPSRNTQKSRVRVIVLCVSALFIFLFFYNNGASSTSSYAQAAVHRANPLATKSRHEPKIGKASMLYGRRNELYERALASHDRHNLIHGYPMHVLRNDMTKGYWNKLSWLLSLVIQELAKPEKTRLNWIMWLDAQNILLNHKIPLSSFLPPQEEYFDNIHFIGSRKDADLCGGAFFIHVHPWTLTFLIRALALPMLSPEVEEQLGYNKDITALATILNETHYRDNVYYVPRLWFNTLDHENDASDGSKGGYEGQGGELLVQFPNDMEGAKWKHMADWLETLRHNPDKYVVSYDKTWYPRAITNFWGRVREARWQLQEGEQGIWTTSPEDHEKELLPAVLDLQDLIHFTPEKDEAMVEAMKRVKEAMARTFSGHL